MFCSSQYSMNAANPLTFVDIAPFSCKDSEDCSTICLAAPLTKRIDQLWAEGSCNGGRDCGPLVSGHYHIHAIGNPASGKADVLLSLSMTAPLMPPGFTLRRWLGSVLYTATGIFPFLVEGEWHYYKKRPLSVDGQPNTSTPVSRLLAVPLGAKCEAAVAFQASNSGPVAGYVVIRDPDLGAYVPDATTKNWFYTVGQFGIGSTIVRTDTVGRVSMADSNASGGLISIYTDGWRIDRSIYR